MAVVGVPDVVVVEAVDIGLELPTIHVDVGNEEEIIVRYIIRITTVRK